MWRIGIEYKMQQFLGVFYRCEEYAQLLHETWLRAYFSLTGEKYWYEIRDVLVPILHMLWGIGTNSSRCEIYGSTLVGSYHMDVLTASDDATPVFLFYYTE